MAWLPAIASVFGSIMASEGQHDANATNLQIQQQNSAFNAEQAQANRDFSSNEAQIQRAYQTDMANTTWQRGVRDMQSAGLNPMLAYSQGGNPAPAGAMGQGSAAQAGAPGNAQNAYAAAGQTAAQWAQIERTMAETENVQADTQNKKDQNPTIKLQEPLTKQTTELLLNQTREMLERVYKTYWEASKVEKEVKEMLDAQKENITADTALKKVNEILAQHDVPRMTAEAAYFRSPVGRESPHNKYGPQTPFRFIEGLGERIINRWGASKHETPDTGQKYHPSGRIR